MMTSSSDMPLTCDAAKKGTFFLDHERDLIIAREEHLT